MTTEQAYGADTLVHLDQRVQVQKRPHMYLGENSLDTALREIIDNSIDEVRAGHGSTVEVTFHSDGSLEVTDDGRGIPTDINTKTGDNGIIMALARIGSGGKFDSTNYQGGAASMGMFGVGASATCVTSSRMTATVYRNNKQHTMEFQNGIPGHFTTANNNPTPNDPFTKDTKLTITKDQRDPNTRKKHPTGTTIRYWTNHSFFPPNLTLNVEDIIDRLKMTSMMVPELTIIVNDLRDPNNPTHTTYDERGGLPVILNTITQDEPLHDPINLTTHGTYTENIQQIQEDGTAKTVEVERRIDIHLIMRWGNGFAHTGRSFVNTIHTSEGGSHVRGMERALTTVFTEKIKSTRGLLTAKDDTPITTEDILEGLTYTLATNIPAPHFQGYEKQRLGGQTIANVINRELTQTLETWVNNRKNTETVKTILNKIVTAYRARHERTLIQEAKKRKTAVKSVSMPAKYLDCSNPNTEYSELLICEGDSALGTLKQARDSTYQALLPIRGKILNAHKASPQKILANAESEAIIKVIGAGMGKTFDHTKMRVNKIILAVDADVDGAHIAVLLTTLFYNITPGLIENGHLYAAVPPLFSVKVGARGDEVHYAEDIAALQELTAELAKQNKKASDVKRLKGLGEMEAEDFWVTTLNPETRTLRRITIKDAEDAQKMIDLAMGPHVAPRKKWIMETPTTSL